MFKFSVEKLNSSVRPSALDLVNAQQEFISIKQNLADACASFEEINAISDNIETAIASIEQFGLCAENLSILNADNALEQIVGQSLRLDEIKNMTEKTLESLEDKCLTALEGANESLWEKFCAGVKRIWEAIKRFFVSIWNRIRSWFADDKDFYKKAMAAYDELHGDAEKKVDEAVKNCKTDFKGFMKSDTQSLHDRISEEDLTLTFGHSDKFTSDTTGQRTVHKSLKGSGFIEYNKAKPFIEGWSKIIKSMNEQTAAAGGPMEFAIKTLSDALKKAHAVTITTEWIDRLYDDVITTLGKLPSMKSKLAQATGGIVECTKLEIDLKGRKVGDRLKEGHRRGMEDPDFAMEIVVHCKEGTLGELGWDKEKLLEVYTLAAKQCEFTMNEDQVARYCDLCKSLVENVKFSDEDDKDLIEIKRDWSKLVRRLDKWCREYLKFIQNLNGEFVALSKKLRFIPNAIIKNIDVFAMISDHADSTDTIDYHHS